jgi:hypothetical protein
LEAGKDGREFVAALERQPNLFDRRDLEIGLGLEVLAHDGIGARMLQVQTTESPQTFNYHTNIRTLTSAPNPMPAHLSSVYLQPLITKRKLRIQSPE